jgi:hypothetical protein
VTATQPHPRRPILSIDATDRWPWLAPIVGLGLVGALYLRVVGLPGADLHGPLHRAGIMDPLCGGTRATLMLVRGDIVASWSWNPLVPLLAVACLAILIRLVVGLATGRWVTLGGSRRWWTTGTIALLLVIEINQQLQAQRLIDVVPK